MSTHSLTFLSFYVLVGTCHRTFPFHRLFSCICACPASICCLSVCPSVCHIVFFCLCLCLSFLSMEKSPLGFRRATNRDVSSGPFPRPFTRSLVHSFARTPHSIACYTLLALLARSAAIIRLLARSLNHSRAHG